MSDAGWARGLTPSGIRHLASGISAAGGCRELRCQDLLNTTLVVAYVGLGSNVGDRKAKLEEALRRLDGVEGICVTRVSSIRETRPVGKTDQPDFLNAVAEIETRLEPGA